MCVKNNTHIYVARTSNNRVISSGDLYCCLLPQCEALRTCHSGFLIAKATINMFQADVDKWWNYLYYYYEKQWRWNWGCIGCKRIPKSFDLLKIWAKALKILVKVVPKVVWLHKLAPKVCINTWDLILEDTPKRGLHDVCGRKFASKVAQKTFQENLGRFGQNPSHPKICLLLHLWWKSIYKLEQLRIDGSLLNLLSSHLSGRSQIVRINDSFSNACYTNCGVPQGSVLGPLLFLIYVNDIAESIESSISLFADDTALLFSSRCPLHLHQVLTRDLHTLFNFIQLVKFMECKF